MAGTPLAIIAGLGNPGPEHRFTRHNAGFWFVDALAHALGAQFRSHARYHGEVCRVPLDDREVVLLKPQTYMNRSGRSVRALLDYLKVPAGLVIRESEIRSLPSSAIACLVTGTEKTILFDTGGKGDLLLANFEKMKVRPSDVQLVVISHNHGDHTGGLLSFLKTNEHTGVYLPAATPEPFVKDAKAHAASVSVVTKPVDICKGVYVVGPLGDKIIEEFYADGLIQSPDDIFTLEARDKRSLKRLKDREGWGEASVDGESH
mgnify:CR=1 FL=1